MKIVIPKAARGVFFSRLFAIEMNDFDVERLLPSLFYLVVTRGRQRGGKKNDPKDFNKFLDALASHSRLEGFEDPTGRRLLERWIRTSIVHMGKVGRAKREEQIEYVLPLTLLSYKAGLPAEIRRQRNAHLFLYRLLLGVLYALDAKPNPQAALGAVLTETFGRGLTVGPAPKYDGTYDGKTHLDLQALLSLCYLDGFDATEASKKEALEPFGPTLPRLAKELGIDLLHYILAYRSRLPVLGLTRGLMALINFELFVYTLRLYYATNTLVATGDLPPAMATSDVVVVPLTYVDFTRERGSESDEIARACVERDLEELRAFHEGAMLLRTLDRFASLQNALKQRIENLETPEYLQALVTVRSDVGMQARGQAEIESILHETMESVAGTAEEVDARELSAEVARQAAGDAVNVCVKLLAGAQTKKAVESYMAWFWSVGGLRKPFGLLSGNLRGRRNWRYAMSDDLLATLVQLAMVEDPTGRLTNVTCRAQLPLAEFLAFLERRFGVIVDRAPQFLDSASTRSAAKNNLEELKRRLRQMGFFEALSDDFTAQYLRLPLYEERAA